MEHMANILSLSACNKSQESISKDFLEGNIVAIGKNSREAKDCRVIVAQVHTYVVVKEIQTPPKDQILVILFVSLSAPLFL